jgi:hypothetical protein
VTEDSGGLVPHYRLAISRHDGHSLECVVTGTEVTRDPGWTTQSYGMTEGAGMVESSLVRAGERRADAVSGADLALGFRRLLRLSSVATAGVPPCPYILQCPCNLLHESWRRQEAHGNRLSRLPLTGRTCDVRFDFLKILILAIPRRLLTSVPTSALEQAAASTAKT